MENTICNNENQSDDDSESSYCSNDSYNITKVINELTYEEEAKEKKDLKKQKLVDEKWMEYAKRHKSFLYTGQSGLQKQIPNDSSPLDIFSLFIDDNIIQQIVTVTNKFAEQQTTLPKSDSDTEDSPIIEWVPTDIYEMKKFFGLAMFMNLVQLGSIPCYWTNEGIFQQKIPRTIMPQDRFEILLKMVHFIDCTDCQLDRLKKIKPFVDILSKKFQELYNPAADIVIDKIFIPWRGQTIFNQHIPNKANLYGLELYRLCSADGYTWSLDFASSRKEKIENICLKLCESLLNEGRTLYVGNLYANYNLGQQLLEKQTHVVGVLKKNETFLPKYVMHTKLKQGEIAAREDENGIVIFKWRNTYYPIMSTKHEPVFAPISSSKPLAIVDYNRKLEPIEHFSEYIISHVANLKDQLKWYQKFSLELVVGVTVVNAWITYKHVTRKEINFYTFQKKLVSQILNITD